MNELRIVIDALEKVKASDIIIYDTKATSPFFDYVIISSASSNRNASAQLSHVKEDLELNGFCIRGVEGEETGWVILNSSNILLHIFSYDERHNFALEKLYMEIPTIPVEDLKD